MQRSFGRYTARRPQLTLNRMAATISRKKKAITKANARKGIYKNDIKEYMMKIYNDRYQGVRGRRNPGIRDGSYAHMINAGH